MKRVILFFSALSLCGCFWTNSKSNKAFTKMDLSGADDDLVIPASLWKAFEAAYPELTEFAASTKKEGEEKKEEPKVEKPKVTNSKKATDEDDMFKRRPTLDPLPLSVLLMEKTPDVMTESNFDVTLPKGGGSIDLKDFLPEKKNGTFFLKVKYDEIMDDKTTKVFYLSNSPHDPGSDLGSGCNRYFEITGYWKKIMGGDGLVLNTVNMRHLRTLAGTFFFVSPVKGRLRLGHLTVTDSRHPDLLCKAEVQR